MKPNDTIDPARVQLHRIFCKSGELMAAWKTIHFSGSLSRKQFHTMGTIHRMILFENREDGVTVGELADELGVSAAAVSQTVTALEEKNLLERVPSKTDRRVVCLRVTSLGDKTMVGVFRRVEKVILETMQPAEVEKLCEALDVVTHHLKNISETLKLEEETL